MHTSSAGAASRRSLRPESAVPHPVAAVRGLMFMIVSAVLAIGLSPVFAQDEVRIVMPDSIAFKSDANVPGVAIAVVAGNPKDGPYTIRARLSPGVKIPAHFHPDQRVVTVISGIYYFGAGDTFDEGRIRGYHPGTVIIVPAGAPHYSTCKEDGAVVQESGFGPTGITMTGK